MDVYRLCRAGFKALDGEGARLFGGRWNSVGKAVVYTSGSRALAALEYLLHVDPADVPADLVVVTIRIPDGVQIAQASRASLPPDWAEATGNAECVAVGDAWVAAGSTAVLSVPAAPMPEESNYLINPAHVDAAVIKVVAERPFVYDPRLVK